MIWNSAWNDEREKIENFTTNLDFTKLAAFVVLYPELQRWLTGLHKDSRHCFHPNAKVQLTWTIGVQFYFCLKTSTYMYIVMVANVQRHKGPEHQHWWHCPNHPGILRFDDVIKWKHFPRYWPFVRGIHRLPVNSPHKDQWRGALMFSLIWTKSWANNREAGYLRRRRAHYDVTVMHLDVSARGNQAMRQHVMD